MFETWVNVPEKFKEIDFQYDHRNIVSIKTGLVRSWVLRSSVRNLAFVKVV